MGNRLKIYLLIGPCITNFIFTLTGPIVHIYFMKLVSTEILALSNLLTIGLAAIVNSSIIKDDIRIWYRKHFLYIVILDIFCFMIINIESIQFIEARFLGLSILNAVSTTLWVAVMQDAINRCISGDNLTNWNACSRSIELYASFAGSTLAIVFTNIDISLCIGMQCIANLLMGITDIKSYHMLNQTIK